MTTPLELQSLAVEIAREAGALAALRRREGVRVAATKSALADIVTDADREVEDLIRARLAAARPGDGFLGEESGAGTSTSGITWVVDPIDGTVNYAYGVPAYAVSIAAVEGPADPAEWTALAGAVFNPAIDELFAAARGEGAWLASAIEGERRLAVAEPSPAGALVGTGFGYDPATHAGDIARLSTVMPLARDIRRIGAASLDLTGVAAGRLDAYYERGLHPWDHAAGALIIEEAGGRVGGYAGKRPGRAMTIAAAPLFFERLTEVVSG
ncbi:inositol monophosphatase family protein [Microbacterium sp. 18062]|uniref:inositol monophosphatase family protein n=1 Tax=Microbacterium sp. 18062 TaxID=2681410 RepID=UPI001356C191|nr:inositol monophosphatase family protein [Microbacterium sp. 18062]